MTLLHCTCGKTVYVSDWEKPSMHCSRCNGDLRPVSELQIHNINFNLVDKFDIRNGDEWVFQMYKQFGFTDIENVHRMGKEDPNWLRKLRWTENCEDEIVQAVLEKNKSQAKRIGVSRIRRDIAWLSLDVGPSIVVEYKPKEV